MAASDPTPRTTPPPGGPPEWPGAPELQSRLDEEIGRAERYGTPVSILLILVENLDEIAREHGGELRQQTLDYIAGALDRELRSFDRIGIPGSRELAIVLPGADGPRGEVVARRVLDRLRAIKVEADERREPLRVSVGLSTWRPESTSSSLLERARAAAARMTGADQRGPRGPFGMRPLSEPPPAPS